MALSTNDRISGPYAANGSQTVFAYDFKIFDDDDLKVVLTDSVGSQTTLAKTTHYTVSGVGSASGGDVTMLTAYATGNTITIYGDAAAVQDTDFSNQGAILPSVVETAMDRIVALIQEIKRRLGATVAAPASDGAIDMTLPAKAARAGLFAAYDSNGKPTAVAGAASTVGVTAFMQTLLGAADAAAAQSTLGILGEHTISWPAAAMVPRGTDGAASTTSETTTNKVMLAALAFDASTQEYAQFSVPMPASWNEGTLKAEFVWTDGVGSGNVIWGIQALAVGDGDALDSAFGTAVEITDTSNGSGDQSTTAQTAVFTPSGTPAQGDVVIFQVYRKAADAGDTLSGDASLLAVRIAYTIDAAVDG